jgi:flagellar hook-associated protein 1 FlgK
LQLEVTDGDSNVITTVNIGSGYAAGDKIDIGETGIEIALSIGDLDETTEDDKFTVQALENADTSGLLAATGINTFFSGSNALDMAVCSNISANPRRVATALGPDMSDNANAVQMKDVKDEVISTLDNLTCGEFYRRLVTDIGQQLSVKQMNQDNIGVMILNLLNQKSEISGVDINDEAAHLLVFEQMFKAMAKHMNVINSSLATLMEIV